MPHRNHVLGAAGLAAALLLTGCTGVASGPGAAPEQDGEITGSIIVLTNRTDLVDTDFARYAEEFAAVYPGTSVQFEALADYSQVNNRLGTGDYGDVLLIPEEVTQEQFATFFEPLGTVSEMEQTYRFVNEKAFDDQVYGLALGGSVEGVAYNQRIWEEAGVTELPTSPEEFLTALAAVEEQTEAIPYYTNYRDGWPLGIWNSQRGSMGVSDVTRTQLTENDAPWSEDLVQGVTDGLLYDIVEAGLAEPDPVTSSWEQSKVMLGAGDVSAMVLGSWSVSQLQEAAEDAGADPADIGFMPFPYQVDGTFHAQVNGDQKAAVSVNSDNKATARAWIEWLVTESDYIETQGFISPVLSEPLPPALADLSDAGVVLVDPPLLAPEVAADLEQITRQSEIDLTGPLYRQAMIDVARGAADGDKASVFADLNQRWAAAAESGS